MAIMNVRRVHELMRKHFPAFDAAALEWTIVFDGNGPRRHELQSLLDAHVPAEELLIYVHRKEGAFLARANAFEYITEHLGKSQMRISDRQFTSFLVIGGNGVAAGWQHNAADVAARSSTT
jgi:hypothetical protein